MMQSVAMRTTIRRGIQFRPRSAMDTMYTSLRMPQRGVRSMEFLRRRSISIMTNQASLYQGANPDLAMSVLSSWLGSGARFFGDASQSSDPPAASLAHLGLHRRLVQPHLDTIRQLPEVQAALDQSGLQSQSAVDNLNRARQVFVSMGDGNPHYIATLSLLADAYCSLQQYDEAVVVLNEIKELCNTNNDSSHVLPLIGLAVSKVLWCDGRFGESRQIASGVVHSEQAFVSDFLRACASHAQALTQLLQRTDDLDHVDATNTSLRFSARALEQAYEQSRSVVVALCTAAALGNCGVAEAAFRQVVVKRSPTVSMSYDGALQCWRDGLSLLDQLEASDGSLLAHETTYIHLMQSRLYCSMTLALLSAPNVVDEEKNLKMASDYASTALHLVEKEQGKVAETEYQCSLGRALGLLATCYRRADSALSAEGLFQSAIDGLRKGTTTPQINLDLRRTYDEYALLCRSWDKRNRDAENMEQNSRDTEANMSGGWGGKPDLYSGLIFFTPDTFTF